MLVLATSMLAMDAVATCLLCVRRRRNRRMRRASGRMDAHPATGRADADAVEREATVRAEWPAAHPALQRSERSPRPSLDGAKPVLRSELHRSAELLAAMPELVYDPVIWET